MNPIGIDLSLLIPGRVGGVETYVRNLLTALAELDENHKYLLFGTKTTLDTIELNQHDFAREIVVPPYGMRNIGFRAFRRLLWETMDFDLVSRRIGKCKVGVLHEPFGIVRIETDTPVVLTVHDIQHEFYPTFFGKRELNERRSWYPKSMRRASMIIAISEFTRQTIIERYSINPDNIVTIHYGLSYIFQSNIDNTVSEHIKAKYNLPDAYVYYPANSWPHKNHARLLRALKLLKDRGILDFHLVLTGVVYPEHQQFLELIEKLNLANEVLHLGHVPYSDQPYIYSLAKCLVFPSLFEGFGNPVLEAMGCGCPVICSNVTSLPEIAGNAARLVDPLSEEDIAEAMYTVVNNDNVRSDLVRLGLSRAQEFSWRTAAMQTRQIYEYVEMQGRRQAVS